MKKILIATLAALLALSIAFAASADGWKELYDQKEYEAAYPLIEKAAEAGDPDAIAHLAACLANGYGTEADPEKGYELAMKAADAGNVYGMFIAGNCFLYGWGTAQDYTKAME